jgi:hypothetical protein
MLTRRAAPSRRSRKSPLRRSRVASAPALKYLEAPCEGIQTYQIVIDQCQFLTVRPAFELAFARKRFLRVVMGLSVHRLDWPTARGPQCASTVVFCYHALLNV